MRTNIRLLLLAIFLGIIFINIPEIHPEFLKITTPVIIDVTALITKSVTPLYEEAIKRSQDRIKNIPIQILVNGEPVEAQAASIAEDTLITNKASGTSSKKKQVNTNPGDFSLTADCSLTPEQYDAVLREYNSPAVGVGEHAYKECKRTRIDNAYVLGIFIHESTAGNNSNWAGNKPDGTTTANVGNIICAGYSSCFGRFRDYNDNWELGTSQTFDLLRCYRDSSDDCGGLWIGDTVTDINGAIKRWSPSEDGNNPESYAGIVRQMTTEWRNANQTIITAEEQAVSDVISSFVPSGCPLGDICVFTQGYNAPSHSPTHIWGGVDLINNDAQYPNSQGRPIYATMDGVANVYPNSGPGGNCVMVVNQDYRTTNCHMQDIIVTQGQDIKRGDQIGTVGATGTQVTGAHLHYEVWEHEVNKDPNNYHVTEGLK